jgi:quercetin dioxygenase-like cupin family protein
MQIIQEAILSSQNSLTIPEILPGAIEGLEVFLHSIEMGNSQTPKEREDACSVFLISSGNGIIKQKNNSFKINELALFVPERIPLFSLHSETEALRVIEFSFALKAEDAEDLEDFKSKLPYFVSYSDCKTYKEAIKSPKTVNRTLLPIGIVPRFSIGSVETSGPDEVGLHKHPMLEQLFLGLSGNDCIVQADGLEAKFGEHSLLHIPLGSEHGVKVEAGKKLHYIWIDLFRNREDMKWLSEMHEDIE